MKSFLGTFAVSLIMCYVFLLFGGVFILQNFWAMLVFVALIIAVLITAFLSLETKIEMLKNKIEGLEDK